MVFGRDRSKENQFLGLGTLGCLAHRQVPHEVVEKVANGVVERVVNVSVNTNTNVNASSHASSNGVPSRFVCTWVAAFVCIVLFGSGLYAQSTVSTERAVEVENFLPAGSLAEEEFARGLGFYNARSYDAARRHFFSALERMGARETATVKRSTIRYYLGLTALKMGYMEEAIQQWSNILRLPQPVRLAELQDLRDRIFWLKQTASAQSPAGTLGRQAVDLPVPVPVPVAYRQNRSFPEDAPVRMSFLSSLWRDATTFRLVTPIALAASPTPSGHVYLLDHSTHELRRVDSQGREVFLADPLHIPFLRYGLRRPYDFLVTPAEDFWVTDLERNQVAHLSAEGDVITRIGETGIADGQFISPRGVTLGPHGNLWVVDSGNARIQVFAPTGNWLRTLGQRGYANGEYLYPTRILYHTPSESFYILDSEANRIQRLSRSGVPLEVLGEGILASPLDIKMVPGNHRQLLVLDQRSLYRMQLPTGTFSQVELLSQEQTIKQTLPLTAQTGIGDTEGVFVETSNAPIVPIVGSPVEERSMASPYIAVLPHRSGEIYLVNGKTGKIDVFGDARASGLNHIVQVERVDASAFPELRIEVSVHDESGAPLGELDKDDFSFYEEGRERVLTEVVPLQGETPVRSIFMVEAGPRTRERSLVVQTLWREWNAAITGTTLSLPLVYGETGDGSLTLRVGTARPTADFATARLEDNALEDNTFVTRALVRSTEERILSAITAGGTGELTGAGSTLQGTGRVSQARGNAASTINATTSQTTDPTLRAGFAATLERGLEQLLPYDDTPAIILLAFTPHDLADWNGEARKGEQNRRTAARAVNFAAGASGYGYSHFQNKARQYGVPFYVVYAGEESLNDPKLIPLRNFAESTGGGIFAYGDVSAGELFRLITHPSAYSSAYSSAYISGGRGNGQGQNNRQGRYILRSRTQARPLGEGLFFPVAVRLQTAEGSGQDSWNGFIHP